MKKYLIISFLIIVIIIGVLSIPKKDDINSFNFDISKKTHYKLEYSTVFDNNHVQYNINDDIKMKANLDMRVFKKDKDFVYIGLQLSNVNISFNNPYLEKKLNDLYSIFFIIKMNYDGKFIAYYFPRKIDDIKGLANLLSMLETTLKNKKIYSDTEQDMTQGFYNVTYRRTHNTLYKTREDYTSFKQNDKMKVILTNSHFKIKIDSAGNWIENLDGSEKLVTKNQADIAVKNRNAISLKKLSSPIDDTLQIWTERKSVDAVIDSFSQKRIKDQFSWQKEKDNSLKVFIKKHNIDTESLLKNMVKKNDLSSAHDLKMYLKLNPNEIKKLYDTVLNGSDVMSSRLINVLERLNNPKAQNLLLQIVNDDGFSDDNKLRAIIALGTQKKLSEDTVESLWSTQEIRDAKVEKERSNTILLALGNISSHANLDTSNEIDQRLKDLLVDDTYNKNVLLYSMQNSGARKFEPEVLNLLETSKSDNIKESAIKVLQEIKSNKIKNILYTQVQTSSSDRVKAAAINALATFKADDKIVKEIQAKVEKYPNSKTKDAMVNYLVKTVTQHPENKKYLKDVLSNIQDDRVKKTIIKTIRN